MEDWGSMQTRFAIPLGLAVILLLTSTLSTSSALIKNFDTSWDNEISVEGGQTLLVEELSTTWCVSCAEIDPYLEQVADSHGSRISIVTYHPSDGEDAFSPVASNLRIQRLKITHPELGSTPSFVVDSGALRVGPDSWPDVQRDIMREETENQQYTKLGFNISNNGENYYAKINKFQPAEIKSGTQISFLLLKHELKVPNGYVNPGEEYRDRVVTGYASCELENNNITNQAGFESIEASQCDNDFAVTFNSSGKFSLILIHEETDQEILLENQSSGSLGVVEFAYRDKTSYDENQILPLTFISILTIGFIWAIYSRIMS